MLGLSTCRFGLIPFSAWPSEIYTENKVALKALNSFIFELQWRYH